MQQHRVLEPLLSILCSRFVHHSSLADLVQDLLRQEMDRDLDGHLQKIFSVVLERTSSFCSGASNVIDMHSATLRQESSSTFTYVNGRVASLVFEFLATTSFTP